MFSLRFNFILLLAALTLVACGSSENSTTSQNSDEGTVQLYGAKVATSAAKLPTCDSNQVGQLFYVLDDEKFQFCSSEGYQSIDLNGDSGADGKNGANGKDGTNGKDGSSCSVIENTNGSKTILCEDGSTATVNDGASCTVDDNGDGSYDLTCSGTKVTVRDGVDGVDGKDGADGVSCLASKSNDSLFVDCNGVLDTIVDGQNGENGADGSSCTISDDNAGTLTQTCTDGTSASWPKALCGTKPYDPATHFCEAGTVLELCGDLTYDPATHFCEAGTVLELCGDLTYDPATHFCNEGTVLDLCGSLTYDPMTHFCEAGTVLELCGDLTYDPATHFCNEGTVLDLCGGLTYDPMTHFCDEETTTPMLSWSAHCLVPGNCGTFSDSRETPAKQYKWTKIGTQTWMAENLKVTKYNDGITIPNVTDNTAWSELTTGALCDYENTPSNSETYGKLYNWYAVNTGKLCPTGWHLPSDAEWTELTDYLGGTSDAGGKLKETGTTHWNSPNTGATNETGFTALPGGYRHSDGTFYKFGYSGDWWSATEYGASSAGTRAVSYGSGGVLRSSYVKELGFSVRCLRD